MMVAAYLSWYIQTEHSRCILSLQDKVHKESMVYEGIPLVTYNYEWEQQGAQLHVRI